MTEEKSIKQILDERRPQRLSLTLTALALSALFNYLFWDIDVFGINFLIYAISFVALFTGIMWRHNHIKNTNALWLLFPILLLSANVARFETPFVSGIVPLVVVVLIIVYCVWLTLEKHKTKNFDVRNVAVVRSPFIWLQFIKYVFQDLQKDSLLGDSTARHKTFNHILLGLAVATPLVLLFVLLFSSADPVFKQLVTDFFAVLNINWETFWRIFLTAVFAMFGAAALYFVASRKHTTQQHTFTPKNFSTTIVNTVLAAVNLIFVFFIYIQVRYLFLGNDVYDMLDLTYAQYAREGFFQLLFVVIVVGLILTTLYGTVTRTKNLALRCLASALTVFSMAVCFSALKRMALYQAEFGQTLLRIHVYAWIIAMIILLLLGLFFLLSRMPLRKLVATEFIVLLVLFVGMSSWNVEAFIANTNITNAVTGERTLDVDYLGALSTDAVPVLFVRYDELSETAKEALHDNFRNDYSWDRIYRRIQNTDWRQHTLSSVAAKHSNKTYKLLQKD